MPAPTPDPARGEEVVSLDRAHVFHSWSAQGGLNPLPIARAPSRHSAWNRAATTCVRGLMPYASTRRRHRRLTAARARCYRGPSNRHNVPIPHPRGDE